MVNQPAEQEVHLRLRRIISDVFKVPEGNITETSRIVDLGLVESIKLLRVAGKIERTFGIELDDEALFRTASVGELADEIVKLRAVQAELS